MGYTMLQGAVVAEPAAAQDVESLFGVELPGAYAGSTRFLN
jgi:hypothetical protein